MIVVMLASCAASPPPQPISIDVPFSDAGFASWAGTGNANIQGQAFLKTLGGDVKTCAGHDVSLIPDNAYSQAMLFAIRQSGGILPPNVDPRVDGYMRTEKCDAQGNFSFNNIRSNKWLVLTRVLWFAPSEYGLNQQGGVLRRSITASPGENRMILTGADEIAR